VRRRKQMKITERTINDITVLDLDGNLALEGQAAAILW
jgi:hypothetical protein